MDLMNQENINKAVEFVRKKYKGCPNCGALGVHIHNVAAMPLIKKVDQSGFTMDNQIIATLPLICDSCGYITFFAAKGIIPLE
jgi:hypothetical protein